MQLEFFKILKASLENKKRKKPTKVHSKINKSGKLTNYMKVILKLTIKSNNFLCVRQRKEENRKKKTIFLRKKELWL